MTAVFVLAAVAAGCVQASALLSAAHWPRRSPAAAIVLWQAIGLGWGLATVGALIGLGTIPQRAGVMGSALSQLASFLHARPLPSFGMLTAVRLACLAGGLLLLSLLIWVLLVASATVLRARQRQRMLLSLLAHGDPKVPGALVVDHPAAAAYCLPGLRSTIVVSAGTLDLLDPDELAAVLAHERAHARERHDLVLLPFTALLHAFRWSQAAREANRAVALLVEMHADDRVLRHRPARELATALLRVGAAGGCRAPSGALAVTGPEPEGEVTARVTRLLRPAPGLSAPALALVGAAAALAVTIPVAVLVIPF
ncbi:MAG TPA: M56 family metallopeptidase [Streptosporangiaceae bacterium]|nr:M56 family metallopeptidase [Streptosporangiaceae bacterium]